MQLSLRPLDQNSNSNIISIDISNIVKPTGMFLIKIIKITLQIFITISRVKVNKISFVLSHVVTRVQTEGHCDLNRHSSGMRTLLKRISSSRFLS